MPSIIPKITINGKESTEISGLIIVSLPPIIKPAMRAVAEEIDGRDGDQIEKLGFSAYDKTIRIALSGNYNVDDVIEYFNQDGIITFSNEPDKYYRFKQLEGIDFEKLMRYKTADVVFHCQPFKFSTTEEELTFFEPHSVSITNAGNIYSKPEIALTGHGNMEMGINGSPVLAVDFGDEQQTIIIDSEKMNAYGAQSNIKSLITEINPKQDLHGYDHAWAGGAGKNKTDIENKTMSGEGYVIGPYPTKINSDDMVLPAGDYAFSFNVNNATYPSSVQLLLYKNSVSQATNTIRIEQNGRYSINIHTESEFNELLLYANSSTGGSFGDLQLEQGSQATNYEPYSNICEIEGFNACDVVRTGKNLFNEDSELVEGFLDADGNINASWAWRTTGLIVCPKTQYLTMSTAPSQEYYAICFYDHNGEYISGIAEFTGVLNYTVLVPLNAVYIRFSLNVDHIDDFQIETGSQATSYVAGESSEKIIDWNINQWDEQWEIGAYTNEGTKDSSSDSIRNKNIIPVIPNRKYYLKCSPDLYYGIWFWGYDKSGNYAGRLFNGNGIKNTEFTIPDGIYFVNIAVYGLTEYNGDISINSPSFYHDYFSYKGNGMIYKARLNITTGRMEILGAIQTTGFARGEIDSSGKLYKIAEINDIVSWLYSREIPNILNNCFTVDSLEHSRESNAGELTQYARAIYVSGYVGKEDILDAILPILSIEYDLESPIILQLTAQEIMALIGENHIFTNTGAIESCVYMKDGAEIEASGEIITFIADVGDIISNAFKNRLVIGNYDDVKLEKGINTITFNPIEEGSEIDEMAISKYSRWL